MVTKGSTLWVGGSSGLARSYVNAFGADDLVLTGVEAEPPEWLEKTTPYYPLDLRQPNTFSVVSTILQEHKIDNLVLSVRGSLIAGSDHEALLMGLSELLHIAWKLGVQHVIHVSSVAAVNHLEAQVSVNESDPLPPIEAYKGSYDRFKRQSEELVDRFFPESARHLRISAIFSDSPHCIQCGALALQARIGPSEMPLRIDCNSGRNAAAAIRCMLSATKEKRKWSSRVYYYTRPMSVKRVPEYGDHLQDYLRAHEYPFRITIPYSLVRYFIILVNWMVWKTPLHRIFRVCVAIDYLLQVAFREHTFDCQKFVNDFPEILPEEESIYECFVRRRRYLENLNLVNSKSD